MVSVDFGRRSDSSARPPRVRALNVVAVAILAGAVALGVRRVDRDARLDPARSS